MRVAYIVDNYRPSGESGFGGTKYLDGLIDHLRPLGLQPSIFARSGGAKGVVEVGGGYRKAGQLAKLRFSRELRLRSELFAGFDLIHSQSASSIPFLAWAHRRGLATLFDCRTSFVRTTPLLSAYQLAALAAGSPSAVSFCDALSARDYRRLLRRPATYVPVPIEIASETGPLRDRPAKTIVFASQLHPEKGLHDLLQAFEEHKAQGGGLRLLLAGEGPLRGEAEALRERYPGDVEVLGLVPYSGMARVLERADLLVHPSQTESVSRTVLEAMAAGVPVLTTARGGMSELASAAVVEVIRPGRPELLRLAIERLAADPGRRAELAARAWSYVRSNHGWEDVLSRILALYAQLGVRPRPAAATAG